MRTRLSLVVMLLFVLVLFERPIRGEDMPQRSIRVTGDAEIKVEPDEVIVTVNISTHAKTAQKAKASNDMVTGEILGLTEVFKIASENVKTTSIKLSPVYKLDNHCDETHEVAGFDFDVGISFLLKDLSQLRPFVDHVTKAGATSVDVDFRSSRQKEHMVEARLQAARAARAKAETLAKELGMKIGAASLIGAGSLSNVLGSGGVGGGRFLGGGHDVFGEQLSYAYGELVIEARVSVMFDLEVASK